jgi:hypothetical protein
MIASILGRSRLRNFPTVLTMMLCCQHSASTIAQEVPARYRSIPSDSVSVLSIDVQVLRNQKEFDVLPWEIITAIGKQELGIDPLVVDTLDFCASMPGMNGPEFGIAFATKDEVDIASLSAKIFSEIAEAPKIDGARFRAMRTAPVKVFQVLPKSVLAGTEGTLRRMAVNRARPNKMFDLVSGSKSPIRLVSAIAPFRPIIDGFFSDVQHSLPADIIEDIQGVIDLVEYIVIFSDLKGTTNKLEVKMVAKDAASAKKLFEHLSDLKTKGLPLLEQDVAQALERDANMSQEVKDATMQYTQRMRRSLDRENLVALQGDAVIVNSEMALTTPTIGVLVGLLLPAVQASRTAAKTMQSANNEKQILLSMLNYESAFKRLPVRVTKSNDGKPLLSWRVAMLPYLEEAALYQEFHQDEPWDSPHNIKLLERMPATFKHPAYVGPAGHTVYLVPYRDDTLWSDPKPKLSLIVDGTSNTIALVEVDDAHAVPWTKPEDLEMDDINLIDCFRFDGSFVGLFDGSVRRLLPSMDPQTLEALVTHNGNEVVELNR